MANKFNELIFRDLPDACIYKAAVDYRLNAVDYFYSYSL
jgi:hypothetical protein